MGITPSEFIGTISSRKPKDSPYIQKGPWTAFEELHLLGLACIAEQLEKLTDRIPSEDTLRDISNLLSQWNDRGALLTQKRGE